jgi:hypothetical protein
LIPLFCDGWAELGWANLIHGCIVWSQHFWCAISYGVSAFRSGLLRVCILLSTLSSSSSSWTRLTISITFNYVISDNAIQSNSPATKKTILEDILPRLPVTVISLEEALEALGNSGPAKW